MKRTVIGMLAVAGTLAGLLAAALPAAAAERGPIVALDKAKIVAGEAKERADEINAKLAEPADEPATDDTDTGTDEQEASAPEADDAEAPADESADAESDADAELDSKVTRASERYDPAQHRDPFEPPTVRAENAETARTPLEKYEVGQLKLVGVVWGPESSRAMVEDSAGLGYIVFQGTPIGSNGGFVRDIEPTRVLIEESSTNFYGETEPREVVLELPQEDASP
jgi:type IV pilus assembly protein PilP